MKSKEKQDFQKAKVILTAMYKNGECFKQEHPTPARVSIAAIPGTEKFKELNLRLAVDTKEAEELLEGLVNGHVTLEIEQMLTAVERAS